MLTVGLRGASARLNTDDEYFPDPEEQVDRWFQAGNSSNMRTTSALITELTHEVVDGANEPITAIVDPFSGAGSAAAAARNLGLPFFGIELDPALACVSIAKTFARSAHLDGCRRHIASSETLAHDLLGSFVPNDLPTRCLEVVASLRAQSGNPLSWTDVVSDLSGAPPVQQASLVLCGDSTNPAVWHRIPHTAGHKVIYTSPPFGHTSGLVAEPGTEKFARRLLDLAGLGIPRGDTRLVDHSYTELVVGMLKNATQALGRVTAIIEHEPTDNSNESLAHVTNRIHADTDAKVRRVVHGRSFSERGPLSLIVCEIRSK